MPGPARSSGRSRALVIFGALCLVGIAGIAIAARDDSSADELVGATDGSTVVTAASELAVTTPATDAATSTTIAPTTTVAPTTVASTTVPTTTLPSGPELVPGFPVPADLDSFAAQLADDPSVIGRHGGEIEDKLARLLDEDSDRKRGDQARKLMDEVDRWVDDGSLAPPVADFLIEHLDPIADDGPGPGDGDDDD
jgi:hypothetical protein